MSNLEIRIINSAIYAEPPTKHEKAYLNGMFLPTDKLAYGDGITEDDVFIHLNYTTNNSNNSTKNNENNNKCLKTYRCVSTPASGFSFLKKERRCKMIDDNLDKDTKEIDNGVLIQENENKRRSVVTRISQSNSDSFQKINGLSLCRQISYEDWKRNKENEMLKKKKVNRTLEIKIKQSTLAKDEAEKERQENENFLRWKKQKEIEKYIAKKKAAKEFKLQRMLNNLNEVFEEMTKAAIAQWRIKKKVEKNVEKKEKKAIHRKIKIEQEKEERLKQKRIEENAKAFEKWVEKSKTIPKPSTQGLLPQHTAKPTFINPHPWQNIRENINKQL